MKLTIAPELEKLGTELVEKYHPTLKILEIGYLFRDEAPNATDGHLLYGQAIPVDSRNWLFHRKDAIIQISQDLWQGLSETHKRLLLDHELCHLGVELDGEGCLVMDENTGRPKVRMQPHDIEEFSIIMQRYGAEYDSFRKTAQKEVQSRLTTRKKKTLEEIKQTV